jgi:predicted GNAT family N-acyltransferase
MPELIFKIIQHGSTEYQDSVALRESILRKPLGLVFTHEELKAERSHIHLAGFLNDKLVATAVLVPEGTKCKMQRVAVKENIQGKGIGSQLITFSEQVAKKKECTEMYCSARGTAIPFYLKNGYVLDGKPYNEAGILHHKMCKKL